MRNIKILTLPARPIIHPPMLRTVPSILKARQVASWTSLTWTMINRATRFLGIDLPGLELLGEKLKG